MFRERRTIKRRTIKGCFIYESRSGLVKSSVQSERKTANSFLFAVLAKAADGLYRHTLRGGFFQKCLKSSPRRGLIIFFPNIILFQ